MMQRIPAMAATRLIALAATCAGLCACATAPADDAFAVGQQVTVEGAVVSADTTPWTYDGSAVVTVSTTAARTVRVHLPARWNLCKAPPPENVQALKPGDRVQVVGTLTAQDELVVCGNAQDRLRRIE